MGPDTNSYCRTVSLQLASTLLPAGPIIVPVEIGESDKSAVGQCRVLLSGLRRVNIVVG